MINYYDDIINEKDPDKRKTNLDKLIAEKTPSELIVLAILAIVSDDDGIRRTALERVDERNRREGNAAARVVSLIQSWKSDGAILTWPEPMDESGKARAAKIEAAFRKGASLASGSISSMEGNATHSKPWWKFW